MQEQLFHAWRSFNFDEDSETIDSYVTQIRQVATLFRLWRTTNPGSIQEYTSEKIILDIISHRGLKASSRNGQREY